MIEVVLKRAINGRDSKSAIMNIDRFDWVPGVGLYGIERVWEYLREESAGVFLNAWIARHRDEAYELRTVNSTAPVMTILAFKGDAETELVKNVADYIIYSAPRLNNGSLEHTVTEAGVKFSGQMWADTLFMVCIMLAKLGKATGDEKYSGEAAKQLFLHHKYLKDTKSGVFFHGYSERFDNHLSAARWARGNAWVTVSTVEILELLPENFKGRDEIIRSLNEQVKAYARYQREDGMFYTVLDRPDGYPETSATAAIAYGVLRGIKDGYISSAYEDVWKRAVRGVMNRIDVDGTVVDVSGGTPIMDTVEEYNTIEVLPTLYGQGLVLLMLCELYKAEGRNYNGKAE